MAGGVLIEGGHRDPERIPRTRAAIDAGTSVIFEGCFEEDGVFCAVDVLEKNGDGWTLIEVKSSSEVKDYHYPDVAVQAHVVKKAGLKVTRMEVMHLNREFRSPDVGPLFVRADVTAEVTALLEQVPQMIAREMEVLRGDLPEQPVGKQCWFRGNDKPCAFFDRCWPQDQGHIRNLYYVGPVKTLQWMAKGVHRMDDIPATAKLNFTQRRQIRSQKSGQLIVEPGLREALKPALEVKRLGFLDFETVGRALPVWNGLGPWRQTAAQFSYHERGADGVVTHAQFLAEGPDDPAQPPEDPREKLARAMLAAAKDAERVVMYTGFEKGRINDLVAALPHLADELVALREKLWDLKPPIADHVYHPDFLGSFSLKDILHPLVPGLSYEDLIIVDGMVASVEIARLLFVSGRIPKEERAKTRQDLLAYCERDTLATLRLVERLKELAQAHC
ncbi:MAG TPA: DUF2779 domain-containing protein [Terracidiphilus sp.]|jgi:hypothetical protein